MQLFAGCEISMEASAPIPVIFSLRSRSGLGQWVFAEDYMLEPNVPVVEYTDIYGNLCQRLVVPQGSFHFS